MLENGVEYDKVDLRQLLQGGLEFLQVLFLGGLFVRLHTSHWTEIFSKHMGLRAHSKTRGAPVG